MGDPGKIGERYRFTQTVYSVVGPEAKLVAKADSSRMTLAFAWLHGGSIVLQTGASAILDLSGNINLGIKLEQTGAYRMELSNDGPLVQSEWYAWDATVSANIPFTTTIMVLETFKTNPSEC